MAFHRGSAPADVELTDFLKKILTLDPARGYPDTQAWSTPKIFTEENEYLSIEPCVEGGAEDTPCCEVGANLSILYPLIAIHRWKLDSKKWK
jgi:hypothetical protein